MELTEIIQLGMAFGSAKVLLTANELELFTVLDAEGPATEPDLREKLGLHGRGSRDFLNALVELGLLAREDGGFRNTAAAEKYLVRGKPTYVGRFLDRCSTVLYPAWGGFTDTLRTGEAQVEGHGDDNMFKRLYQDEQQMRDFAAMMDALNTAVSAELAETYDWSRHREIVDVGGCRGNVAAVLVKAHPHLRATVFDLPPMRPAFDEHVGELNLTDRITFHGGDFFADDLPEADAVVLGHVLEDWSVERKQILIRKAFSALRPGGALLVYDPMLDDELSSLGNLLTSLTMLVVTHGGAEYTVDECREWMLAAGFAGTSVKPLGTQDILVIGTKA